MHSIKTFQLKVIKIVGARKFTICLVNSSMIKTNAEETFCSEADAKAAGYRAAGYRASKK